MMKVCFTFFPLLISLIVVDCTVAHVVLDYPVGGETFVIGDNVNIQWHISISHNQENWDLYFSDDGGANWEAIQLDLHPAQLSYQWIVPQLATEQARIKIYMDNTGGDYDDISADFTIQESTASVKESEEYPQIFALYPNYPNPFNPITLISYELSTVSDVQLTIYNLLGQRVKSLVNERQSVGIYQVQWDGRDIKGESVSSGIYLYRLQAGSFIQTRKMVLVR
jgi:hypothetical protein